MQERSAGTLSRPLQLLAEGESPALETFVAVLSAVGLTIDFKPLNRVVSSEIPSFFKKLGIFWLLQVMTQRFSPLLK